MKPIFHQKRAAARKALLSKKQNFETGVRAFIFVLKFHCFVHPFSCFRQFDFRCRHPLQLAAVRKFFIIVPVGSHFNPCIAAIVYKAIEDFKQAKADMMQFNMNKSEISDDSRLFKIQGDLNLIDHEITSVTHPFPLKSVLRTIVFHTFLGFSGIGL